MRKIPDMQQAALNPLDNYMADGSTRFYKKPFMSVNQHYITHKAIIPDIHSI